MEPREIPVDETYRVVGGAARRYRRYCSIPYDDLVGVGMLGVVKHAGRHDPARLAWPEFAGMAARSAMRHEIARECRRRMASLPPAAHHREPPPPGPFAVSALSVLTDKQAEALVWCLGLDGAEPRTDSYVATILGTDRLAVMRRRERAIDRLRKYLSEGDAA